MSEMLRPTACSDVQPNSCSAPWFQVWITPSIDLLTIASCDEVTIAASRLAAASSAALRRSASRRSATSRKISTQPDTCSRSSRIGEALSSIARSLPSRRISTEWFSRPATPPSRITRCARFLMGMRVASSITRNTRSSGSPVASARLQAVSSSATAFMYVTRPRRSVVMTASPMLARVMRRTSRCSRRRSLRAAHHVAEADDDRAGHEVGDGSDGAAGRREVDRAARLDEQNLARHEADDRGEQTRTPAAPPDRRRNRAVQRDQRQGVAEPGVEQPSEARPRTRSRRERSHSSGLGSGSGRGRLVRSSTRRHAG